MFGEADDLPALIVDKYADVLVVQCLSLGVHQRKEIIVGALREIFSPRGIYERSDSAVRAKEGLPPEKGVLWGEVPDEVIIEENGIRMSVDVKTAKRRAISSTKRKTASPSAAMPRAERCWIASATAAASR